MPNSLPFWLIGSTLTAVGAQEGGRVKVHAISFVSSARAASIIDTGSVRWLFLTEEYKSHRLALRIERWSFCLRSPAVDWYASCDNFLILEGVRLFPYMLLIN